jgi:hypothetical protein
MPQKIIFAAICADLTASTASSNLGLPGGGGNLRGELSWFGEWGPSWCGWRNVVGRERGGKLDDPCRLENISICLMLPLL